YAVQLRIAKVKQTTTNGIDSTTNGKRRIRANNDEGLLLRVVELKSTDSIGGHRIPGTGVVVAPNLQNMQEGAAMVTAVMSVFLVDKLSPAA
ncbi:MAG: hypothetical protein MZV64_10455, partial [Ignavibacteriales bacterium]|nr:hypothetical protein [Ignavibacteriales bacterium]